MLRISDVETITDENNIADTIPKLLKKINPILEKRRKLHEIYSRKANDGKLMFSSDIKNTVISYEKFLTDISAGYLSGKPIYSVASTIDEDRKQLLKEILNKETDDESYKQEMEILIDYITGFNDDETEHHDLVHDILELTSCYEILYENEDNEIVYSRYSPLNTVAIWDYSIPANLLALVRVWDEKDINEEVVKKCEITDKLGTKTYSMTEQYKEVNEDDNQNHNWGDVPAIAVETDFSIFEPCEDVIQAYQQLIQNIRNTYQYNDSDCKLKFSGYTTENPITITEIEEDENGNTKEVIKENPARIIEDKYIEKAKTLYVQDGGDVGYITKPLDSSGAVEILKVYTNLMFQLAGIPNTTDLAFNSADLNASAIDRKFYIMNMMTANIISELKKAYARRWELIFGRINLKKNTMYDFRDIDIDLPKNLPANDDEKIDSTLKLQNILSEQTIIEKLGYNYLDERNKKDSEAEENMMNNIERMKMLEMSGAEIDETTIQEQTGQEEMKTSKSSEEIIDEIDSKNKERKKEEVKEEK